MRSATPLWQVRALVLISAAAMAVSLALWGRGLLQSPLAEPRLIQEERYLEAFVDTASPDRQREKLLAEAYWRRYRDVREDRTWGERGPMGIRGPRDHYSQHGKREGRIFAPVIEPEDLAQEKELAETYWRRYPDIRASAIWGDGSDLGILGPRDYHTHIGRHQGRLWGHDNLP
jgi:hypothetical protein